MLQWHQKQESASVSSTDNLSRSQGYTEKSGLNLFFDGKNNLHRCKILSGTLVYAQVSYAITGIGAQGHSGVPEIAEGYRSSGKVGRCRGKKNVVGIVTASRS